MEIKKVNNGYTLETEDGVYVYGDTHCELVEMLYTIKNELVSESRYDEERIFIYVANGDKYEGKHKDKSCPHCEREYK